MKKTLHIYKYGNLYARYFQPYLLPNWDITYNSPTPHIVYLSKHKDLIQILTARMKFGWGPLLCVRHAEASPLTYSHYVDYSFSFASTDSKNCCISLAPKSGDSYHPSTLNTKHPLSAHPKTNFCNFVYSTGGGDRKVRENFCKLLMKYKKVDCPGLVLNNTKPIKGHYEEGSMQAKLDFVSSYKFTIAFENTSNDYYITEKIFHPLMVGSIPIYWGCTKIEEYINPNAIINCHNYKSFDEVIEKVKAIDNNPDLYQQYINAKPVLSSSRFYQTERELKQRVQHIAAEALERRKTIRIDRWTNLWKLLCFIWKNKGAIIVIYIKAFIDRQKNRVPRNLVLLVRKIQNRFIHKTPTNKITKRNA